MKLLRSELTPPPPPDHYTYVELSATKVAGSTKTVLYYVNCFDQHIFGDQLLLDWIMTIKIRININKVLQFGCGYLWLSCSLMCLLGDDLGSLDCCDVNSFGLLAVPDFLNKELYRLLDILTTGENNFNGKLLKKKQMILYSVYLIIYFFIFMEI